MKSSVVDRLTTDWGVTTLSADSQIYRSLKNLRARSRVLRDENGYAKKFFSMVKTNVVGDQGVHLKMKVKDPDTYRGTEVIEGKPDIFANRIIEMRWKEWGRREHCSVDGGLSWKDLCRLVIETVAVDGEVLVRMIRLGDPFMFALEVLECDFLDEELNKDLGDGRHIRMGVEQDKFGRPVNYWLHRRNPNDEYPIGNMNGKRYNVVPAADMMHLFVRHRPKQTRGLPWLWAGMFRLNQLGAYEESEVIAARIGAAKMGFIEPSIDVQYAGDQDEAGNAIMEVEPGTFERLNPGEKVSSYDPQHPNSSYEAFVKTSLRGVAAAANVNYNTMANDWQSVNFSSGRLGMTEEREHWKSIQCWFIEDFVRQVFERWLSLQLASQVIPLPDSKFEKFNAPFWQPRRWSYIQPEVEVKAHIEAIKYGLTSRTRVLAEQGLELSDILKELQEEDDMADKLGVSIDESAEEAPEMAEEKTPDMPGEMEGKE